MGDYTTTKLSKALMPLTLVSLVLYAVGFGNPYWLKVSFKVPAPSPPLPPGMLLDVDANMGLFKSCKVVHLPAAAGGDKPSDCSSEGASDWQWVAAGFAIFGLFLAIVALVYMVLVVLAKVVRGTKKLQAMVATCNLLSGSSIAVSLILYGTHRQFEATGPATWDVAWSFFVCVCSSGAFIALFALHIVDIRKPMAFGDMTSSGENNQYINYAHSTGRVSGINQ